MHKNCKLFVGKTTKSIDNILSVFTFFNLFVFFYNTSSACSGFNHSDDSEFLNSRGENFPFSPYGSPCNLAQIAYSPFFGPLIATLIIKPHPSFLDHPPIMKFERYLVSVWVGEGYIFICFKHLNFFINTKLILFGNVTLL